MPVWKARISLAPLPLSLSRFLFMPSSDKTIVYVDASRGDTCSGLGYVIMGDVEREGRRVLDGTHTSMEAEFHALMEGLRVASQASAERAEVEVYTDAKPLVKKMRVPDEDKDWYDRRRSCHWLLNKWDEWELEHVYRGGNETAHELAREALFEGRERNV